MPPLSLSPQWGSPSPISLEVCSPSSKVSRSRPWLPGASTPDPDPLLRSVFIPMTTMGVPGQWVFTSGLHFSLGNKRQFRAKGDASDTQNHTHTHTHTHTRTYQQTEARTYQQTEAQGYHIQYHTHPVSLQQLQGIHESNDHALNSCWRSSIWAKVNWNFHVHAHCSYWSKSLLDKTTP